jgi:hypothetical protein
MDCSFGLTMASLPPLSEEAIYCQQSRTLMYAARISKPGSSGYFENLELIGDAAE